ncbi:MAG: gluconolaconase [Flavobacteriaceae bacterium]
MKNKNHLLHNNFLLLLAVCLFANGQEKTKPIAFPVDVGTRPESITKGFEGNYFVTVMNAKETGDGGVNIISADGVKPFFRGADEPKGIVYVNDHLYFSDVTRVWKVDKDGNGEVFMDKTDFPEEVLYLNDVSLDAKGTGIYIVDMGATKFMRDENSNLWPLDSEEAKRVPNLGRVYHVGLDRTISIAQNTSELMPNPNGVGIDNNGNFMIASFFKGNVLVNKNGEMTPLKGVFRGADAVEQDKNGDYYVSSWQEGKVWKIDGKTEEATVLIEGLQSAADFYLEEEKGRLLLPDMKAGKVLAVDTHK